MIWFAWALVIWLAFIWFFWWLFFRNASNEFTDGIEIDESDLAGAVESDLRNFISEQRTRV